ncbi:hypothetical protein WA026_007601 [Henosepilachna vigintioctopunctata]|uniref:Serendipity locus protein alpha n=1 Tax=Henosepilachna vigintioctopunctata TaxID=420089 RepID=A0AAW1UW97_9CUCU
MEQSIQSCRDCLQEVFSLQVPLPLNNSAFKTICSSVATVISSSNSIIKSKFESKSYCPYRDFLIFQFTQLMSALELLADVIINEQKLNMILKSCRKSMCKRINFCLDTIGGIFKSKIELNNSGCFLRWMDNALQKIIEVDIDIGQSNCLKKFQEASTLFEDILSHAMSIAQICLAEDSKAIKGSTLTVLEALEDLKHAISEKKLNKAMVTLFVDICGDKLCALERRVDIAVLKLTLKVFSQYLLPLENIFKFCEENSGNEYDQQKFDNIVADFDLHVDRIMQIGLFAVFCSSNIKLGRNIRNCMASLEYLELELIPVAQMLLAHNSEVNQTSALIFKNYWICEANKLRSLIFEIVDPSAFCQIIKDAIYVELDVLLEKYRNKKDFSKCSFDTFIQHATVLTDFLLTVFRCEDITTKSFLKDQIKNCCTVVREIQNAIEVLDDNSSETNNRTLKRCRIFKSQLKKMLLLFRKENLTEDIPTFKEENNPTFASQEKKNLFENKFLDHIMNRGKNILDNRSILYRTPNKPTNSKWTSGDGTKMENSLKLHKIHLSFNSSQEVGSFEFHITDILDNLSKLSSTFDPTTTT